MSREGDVASGGVESLYPFLYEAGTSVSSVLEEVARSTAEKAAEIVALRATVAERYGSLLGECAGRLSRSFAGGGRLLAFGNGGSSTDAQDVTQTFLSPPSGTALPALCLSNDVAVLTALANDIGFDVVFARQIAALGRPGDIALGISTSGGSENVLAGFAEARRRGLVTVGLAGYDGGRMRDAGTVDYLFVIPSSSVHRIQEAQTTTYHVLWTLTQQALGEGGVH
ncbi:MAG TPA: SIS domain-containing protein [Acidimicrobiales bacterium]|jgi:D-sedoheptulose 7-phosphate isomerase|nr:SIS domain-containing protein [Acidimicrobiales bacterium]